MMPRLPLLPIPAYGLLVAAGFVVALVLAWRLAPRAGLDRRLVQDVMVWASLWGILGAKAALILLEPAAFFAAPWQILFEGGVFYGGAVSGALAGWLRARRLGLPVAGVADVIAPCLAAAHVLGRIGCFLAGCCFGSACDAPWAVRYSDPLAPSVVAGVEAGQGLHPAQLYEAAGLLALATLLVALLPRRRFAGQVWWTYAGGYAALRFAVEFFRGDARGDLGPFSTSQLVALPVFLASVVMLWRLSRRARA